MPLIDQRRQQVETFNVGDSVVTTVHAIGGRQEDVIGTVTGRSMSRKAATRVLSYVVDATESGHGKLIVEAAKARSVA